MTQCFTVLDGLLLFKPMYENASPRVMSLVMGSHSGFTFEAGNFATDNVHLNGNNHSLIASCNWVGILSVQLFAIMFNNPADASV